MATFYIDPTAGSGGDGSFGAPFDSWADVTWTAGNSYLQKRGTTFSGRITVGASGTSGSRIVVGVYDATSGEQVSDELGAAIVLANGDGTAPAINSARDFVSIIGLDAQNAGGTANLIRNGSDDGAVVEYCRASTGGGNGISLFQQSGTSCVARYNEACDNGTGSNGSGIALEGTPAVSWSGVDISGNVCDRNKKAGIWLIPYDDVTKFVGLQAVGNFCRDNVADAGLRITANADSGSVASNVCTGNIYGIELGPYATGTRLTKLELLGNTCTGNRRFGIHLVKATGWIVRANTCSQNGEDLTPWYGRGIEVVGASGQLCAGQLFDNDCHENYNYGGSADNGTEGTGIGIDDYCGDVVVRGNRCYRNEGGGIQCNPNGAGGTVTVEGNLLIDNYRVDATRAAAAGWQATSHVFAQISLGDTQNNMLVRGNTLISNNVSTCWYGVSENNGAAGTGTDVRNNTIVGHSVAGLKVRTGITRTHNAFSGNAKNVESNADTTTLSDGTSAVTAAPLLTSTGVPMTSSPVIGAGTHLGYTTDNDRRQRSNPPSIGAYEGPVTRTAATARTAATTASAATAREERT